MENSLQAQRKGVRRDITIAVIVTCLSLVAVWWSTRSSLTALGDSGETRVCPAIRPAPPSCFPAWHVQVAALITLAVVAALAGAVVAIRARGRAAPATLAVVVVVGLLAWVVVADANRFLPIW